VCDHAEELQRKCIAHERKPLSKLLIDELRAQREAADAAAAAEAEAMKVEGEDVVKAEGEEKPAVAPAKEKPAESREWKRNGS
jgi:hypothetical protein